MAKLLTRVGAVAIVAAISPYQKSREEARCKIGRLVEVYVKCLIDACIRRACKGLYGNAMRGEIQNFTGVSDLYEEPQNPEVVLETDHESPQTSLHRLLAQLKREGYLGDRMGQTD